MSWDDSQPDGLDELLHKASWPDAPTEQIERLQGAWAQTVRRRKIRSTTLLAAAVMIPAACLVGSLAIWQSRRTLETPVVQSSDDTPPIIAQHAPQVELPELPHSNSAHDPTAEPPEPIRQIVLEPNTYERSLALLQRHQVVAEDPRKISIDSPPTAPTVPSDIAAAGDNPNRPNPNVPNVEQLFAAMSDPHFSVRIAAAHALGAQNNPAISERLARMAVDDINRRAALVGLMTSADPVARRFLNYAQQDLTLAATMRTVASRYLDTSSVN